MNLGEALNKFYVDILGMKADDPAVVKALVNLGDLAKMDLGAVPVETFSNLFITIDQAKKNPAVEKHFVDVLKPAAFAEAMKTTEDGLLYLAKDSGLKDDALLEYEKTIRNKDLKISERLGAATKALIELNKKPTDGESQKAIDELKEQVRKLKLEKTTEVETIKSAHKTELDAVNARIVGDKVFAYALEKIKFRDDIPNKNKSIAGEIASGIMNKFHVATTDEGGFKLMQKDAPDKEAFDQTTGKPLLFESHLDTIFGAEWRAKDANGQNANGKKPFVAKEKEGEDGKVIAANVQKHMTEVKRSIKASQGD